MDIQNLQKDSALFLPPVRSAVIARSRAALGDTHGQLTQVSLICDVLSTDCGKRAKKITVQMSCRTNGYSDGNGQQ